MDTNKIKPKDLRWNEFIQISLREYQKKIIKQLWSWFRLNKTGNPLIKAPTGSGKTHILAGIIIDALSFKSSKIIRVLVVTQSTTLVKQNSTKFKEVASQIDYGINASKLDKRDTENQVIFASITSIYKCEIGTFDLILVDECHEIPDSDDAMYRQLFNNQKKLNPRIRIIGLTATDYRLSTGKLTEGKNKLFTEIAAEITIQELLNLGYLVPIRYVKTAFVVSMDKVNLKGNEYDKDEAAKEMMKNNKTVDALDDAIIFSKKHNLHTWKIYCANLAHCKKVSEYLSSKEISNALIDGKTKQKDRDRIISDFSSGNITCLVSCETLITGFDVPRIDHIINLKPTTSKSRWDQLNGRGMRPFRRGTSREKKQCYLSDYTPNTDNLGRADMLDVNTDIFECTNLIRSKVNRCPVCGMALNRYDQQCDYCGFSFDISRFAILTSEALISHCRKLKIEIPSDLVLLTIKSYQISIFTRNNEKYIRIIFIGAEGEVALSKQNNRPVINEFIKVSSIKPDILHFFTSIKDVNNLKGRSATELVHSMNSHFCAPKLVISKKNKKGYYYPIAYVGTKYKKLHWRYDNNEVMHNLFL